VVSEGENAEYIEKSGCPIVFLHPSDCRKLLVIYYAILKRYRIARTKRQRRVIIPAWGEAPGKQTTETQGLKARLIFYANDESGFQPLGECRTMNLGLRPRLG
jgi:hypothetical protein